MAGDGLQNDRAVLDGPAHPTGVIEGEGVGVDAGAALSAAARHQVLAGGAMGFYAVAPA
jgi:hypothetical protein